MPTEPTPDGAGGDKPTSTGATPPRRYSGSCHCGEIRFAFSGPEIAEAMRCNCSICKRKGALMTDFVIAPEQMSFGPGDCRTSIYRFDDGTAKHHFCPRCGIFTYVETRLDPGHYRVNLGCVDGIDCGSLTVRVYDGEAL